MCTNKPILTLLMQIFVMLLVYTPSYTMIFHVLFQNFPIIVAVLGSLFHSGIVAMITWCYFRISSIGPGLIPRDYTLSDSEVTEKRYCNVCLRYKPPRTHHCRICNTCIPKMDHHCPFVSCCVGFRNHKSFVLFCFYVVIGCCHSISYTAYQIYVIFTSSMSLVEKIEQTNFIPICIIFTIAVPILLSVGSLWVYHVILLLRNFTTLEYKQYNKRNKTKRERLQILCQYNKGFKENFLEEFGSNKLKWFLPTPTTAPHEGIFWESKLSIGSNV